MSGRRSGDISNVNEAFNMQTEWQSAQVHEGEIQKDVKVRSMLGMGATTGTNFCWQLAQSSELLALRTEHRALRSLIPRSYSPWPSMPAAAGRCYPP